MSGSVARATLVADSVWIVVATVVAQVVAAISGIVVKRLLGPGDVAAWALGSSVLGYVALTQMGVLEAVLLRGPLLIRRGHNVLRGLVVPAVMWILLIAIPATACLLVLCVLSDGRSSPRNLLGLALVVPLVVPFQLGTLGVTLARTRGDFRRLAVATILNGIVTGVVGLVLVYYFGLVGQGVAFGLGLVVQLAVFATYRRTAVEWRAPLTRRTWRTAQAMIGYGFPLQSGTAVFSVRQAIDTVLAVMFLGPLLGGTYALAASFRSYLVSLPTAFGTVLFRALRTHHGGKTAAATPRPPEEWWITALAVNFLTLVVPGAAVLALLGPSVVGWFLPRFLGGPALTAFVPVAAATMMMEPVPLQRLLASGATRQFRWSSLVALGGAAGGAAPGLATRSPLLTLLGVGTGSVVTFVFVMHLALAQSAVSRAERIRVWLWCLVGFVSVGGISLLGWFLQMGWLSDHTLLARASTAATLASATFIGGALLARRMGRSNDA